MREPAQWPADLDVSIREAHDQAGRPPREAPLRFETVTDAAAIDALSAEWLSLSRACGTSRQVFQGCEWLAIWRSLYLGGSIRAAVVTGRVEGRLVCVWPLVVEHRFGLRILSGMGKPLSQYCDAIIDDAVGEAERDAALAYVVGLPVDVVALHRVREDAALAAALRRRFGSGTAHQTAPVVDFTGSEDAAAFQRRFPGKLRANRNRRRRRLEQHGPLAFDHFGPSPEAVALVRAALGFKRTWARRRGIIAPVLHDPRFERFFAEAAAPGRGVPGLRVSGLRRGLDLLGVEISVLCEGTLFGHVLAPNPEYLSLGVGSVLAEETMLNALGRGCSGLDLLAPADPYKLEWATGSAGVADYVVPLTAAGRVYARAWLGFGRDLLKKVAKRAGPVVAVLSKSPWQR